ncbi:MAG: 6-phosphogluconolactonase [Gemmatimonadales bacterium]|nr:6-phosphogluconolactonase [Gemmatimonadales bacterium]MDQ3427291.1 6-phosphogluconolactonase [Gemmatimonadota bacterium]
MTTELMVAERAAFASSAAGRLSAEIRRLLESQERCSLALAGGSTPRPVYERVAAELPGRESWSRIDLFFGDERCVPPGHPASNYGMVKEALLDRVPVDSAQIHRMEGERPNPDEAARAYEGLLPERLDLLVLGLGSDGHTASLFPGAPSLGETRRRVLAVKSPAPPVNRLTVTPPVILGARLTIVLVAGAEKAEALARAISGPYDPDRAPGQLARSGLWVADTAAAAGLEPLRR